MQQRAITVVLLVGLFFGLITLVSGMSTWRLPYDQQGYTPVQPIDYSHRLHAGELQIDCKFCHSAAEHSRHAGIPASGHHGWKLRPTTAAGRLIGKNAAEFIRTADSQFQYVQADVSLTKTGRRYDLAKTQTFDMTTMPRNVSPYGGEVRASGSRNHS